jgi:tRNA dimethylallyltransferase
MPTSLLVIPAIIGPTAVGKTELSIALAEHIDGEIISADSRQIYKQLSIGTAKPDSEQLQRVPHHFIDELDITQPFSAGRFAEAATERIDEILRRGRTPIVVGGSTLYIEALVHGLAEIPPTTAATRLMLMERLDREGEDALFRELLTVDPASAGTMDATKTQRVVRALEVYMDTGQPLSSYHMQKVASPYRFAPRVLTRPRPELYDRINRRVDDMIEQGLIEENRILQHLVQSRTPNPLRTIGYCEPLSYLRGEIEHDEMVRQIKRNTRRYAKRQLTWFRRHDEYVWIDLSEADRVRKDGALIAITGSLKYE